MGLMVQYQPRRFGRRRANTIAVTVGFLLLWIFRDDLRLDRVGLDPSLVPWMPGPPLDVFDAHVLDSDAIKDVCNSVAWDTGSEMQVVFTCDNSVGGIGNIRNSILNCVRYTMLAGGSLVVPRIFVRNESDISQVRTGWRADLDYMFDRGHFIRSLRLSCPQLRLFNTVDDVHRTLGAPRTWTLGLFPESLVEEDQIRSTGIEHPERWKGLLYDWLQKVEEENDVSPTGGHAEGPMIVELGRSYLTYPINTDGEAFANAFGGILKFRRDVRELATAIILEINIAFFGAHLRTEKDTWNTSGPDLGEWSAYTRQTTAYLEQATRSNLTVMYVASGNATQVATFAREAHDSHGIRVVTKRDLLRGRNRMRLDGLAWDQRALVDYLVMLGAAQFAGVGYSAFAWNVALRRHMFARNRRHLEGPQMLSDDLNQVYGTPKKSPEYASCMWP